MNAMESVLDVCYSHEGTSLELNDIPAIDADVWLLGKKYNALRDNDQIKKEIYSKMWITYRKNFVPIGDVVGLTTDKGWGCMLRCGQMVLAQALINLKLGRDWLWEPDTQDRTYLEIVKRFEDRRQAPFSIHQIANMGISEGKSIGEWFGPNTVAQVLKKLIKYDDWSSLAIHVALDNILVINEIRELCFTKNADQDLINIWKPLFLIVPLRVGLSEMNPIYVRGILNCFKLKQSLGIIGGKPNLALYFIGCIGNEVICLDPHTTQKAGSVGEKKSQEQIEMDLTYHCNRTARMNVLAMDPSIALCFYCHTETDFNELLTSIKEDIVTVDNQMLFEITLDRPKEYVSDITAMEALGATSLYHSTNTDSDEFEIL